MKFIVRKTSLYLILVVTALLVLSDSLAALMRGKDLDFHTAAAGTGSLTPADFVALVTIAFLVSVLVPVSYALYQFFSLRLAGQAALTRVIWGILLAGALALRGLALSFTSVFSVFSFVCLTVLFVHHLLMKSAGSGERSPDR